MNLYTETFKLLEMGGWVTIPLLISSSLLWYAIVSRWFKLRRGYKGSVRMLVKDMFNGRFEANTVLTSACQKACQVFKTSKPEHLKGSLEEELRFFEKDLGQFRSLVETLVMTAPLMGLLGTVIGMIETFESLGDMNLFTQSGGIAGGISQALITTQMGLIIAIPGLLLDRFFKRREEILQNEIYQIQEIICQI